MAFYFVQRWTKTVTSICVISEILRNQTTAKFGKLQAVNFCFKQLSDSHCSICLSATWYYAPVELLTSSLYFKAMRNSGVVGCDSNSPRSVEARPELDYTWDIWSSGCVFQQILGGSHPFEASRLDCLHTDCAADCRRCV